MMSVYTVQAGDTLESIAKLFLVSVTDLQKWNNGKFPSLYSTTLPMTPGWVINVSPPSRTTYNVTDFGAIGHDITRNDGSVIAGSTTFVSKDGTFKSGDVGTNITVDYAATNTTLSDMLIQGASYSLLTVNPLTTEIASGANVVVQFGTYTQTFVAAATAPVGAIYVTITAQVANYSYPIGSYVDPANLTTTITSVSSPTLITLGADATITAFGLSYTYTPDDTQAINSTLATAANANGIVSFPPGVFICNGASSPNQVDGWLEVVGAGRGATILLSNVACGETFTLAMPGSISDLTVDGGGVATNGLSLSPNAGPSITRQEAHRVTARNISTTGTWILVAWNSYGPLNNGVIETLVLDDISIEGPSNPSIDAMAISSGGVVFVKNMTISGVSRTPNFYTIDTLFIDGLSVSNFSSSGGGDVVIDSHVNQALVSHVHCDRGCGLLINSPNAAITDSIIDGSVLLNYADVNPIVLFNDCTLTGGVGIEGRMQSITIKGGQCGNPTVSAITDYSASGTVHNSIEISGVILPVGKNIFESFSGTTVDTLSVHDCIGSNVGRVLEYCSLVSGSTTLTCSTGNFTSSDVGRIVQDTNSSNVIPTGTTISSVTNTTTAVLSNAATASTSNDTVVLQEINGTIGMTYNTTLGSSSCYYNNTGLNPTGQQTAPSMPASGTALTNPFPFDVNVYITGGTVTAIEVAAGTTGLTSGSFYLPAGESITITYSAAPTWVWIGN